MENENINSYNKMSTFLKEEKNSTGSEYIIFDFEYSSHESFKNLFPNEKRHRCNINLNGLSPYMFRNLDFQNSSLENEL